MFLTQPSSQQTNIHLDGKYIYMKDWHTILSSETNRYILARHLGVDSLSCFVCAYMGWSYRHPFLTNIYQAAWKGKSSAFPASAAEHRGYTYSPKSFYLSLFFLAYQIKNLIDTILWNDGPEYVFHHVLSLSVCWGALYPGFALDYATFFFGLSEISTCVLCILANFDDDHGVVGLGEAFPLAKIIIGVIFVVFFILCRAILWPIVSYYFTRDALTCLKGDNPEVNKRRFVIKMHCFCLVGLSVLQLSWLVVIYFIAIKEFKAIGLL
jgi:TLC domain